MMPLPDCIGQPVEHFPEKVVAASWLSLSPTRPARYALAGPVACMQHNDSHIELSISYKAFASVNDAKHM